MNAIQPLDGQYTGESGVIYTEADAAQELLAQQRESIGSEALSTLGTYFLEGEAILERYLFLPNAETIRFYRAAKEANLTPTTATFRETEFTSTNPEKVAALRPAFLWPKGQKTRQWLVEPSNRWGDVGTCPTIFGITTEEYWRNVSRLRASSSDLEDNEARWLRESEAFTHDRSKLYGEFSKKAGDDKATSGSYYLAKSLIYLTSAVLFEDFEGGPNGGSGLKKFVESRVLPAQEELYRRFGAVPLVVRLPAASDNLEVDMRNLTEEANDTITRAGLKFTP